MTWLSDASDAGRRWDEFSSITFERLQSGGMPESFCVRHTSSLHRGRFATDDFGVDIEASLKCSWYSEQRCDQIMI